MTKISVTLTLLILMLTGLKAQTQGQGHHIDISEQNLSITGISYQGNHYGMTAIPLISFRIDNKLVTGSMCEREATQDSVSYIWDQKLRISYERFTEYAPAEGLRIYFLNISQDTLDITNVVPFGEEPSRMYITGKGEHYLSRTHLFRPGYNPVNVIVPDNAWELGFSEIQFKEGHSLAALCRRESSSAAHRHRFSTTLYPGGWVSYRLWSEPYTGAWQEGIRKIFQERYLYDVLPGAFDNSLFERPDLQWIRHTYANTSIMAWDNYYYDCADDSFNLLGFEEYCRELYGGNDFIALWPTWPTLGVDQRNQWDLYRSLPGGMEKIRSLAEGLQNSGSRLFICYNPWDQSTRDEEHARGMASIIKATKADGVVLDTRGESSYELQHAADSVRPGVVMYSEGMAVPENMQGIVSGRVHNALYYCPMLNLNKFIKPEFAIFRVAELFREPIRREYNLSFFNGYGTEMNLFHPGKPDWAEEQYLYWGKILRIQRENTHNFVSRDYIPLIPTRRDSIFVNYWPGETKTIYTIYSLIPGGYNDLLFEVQPKEGYHFVDIWHHTELEPVKEGGKWYIHAKTNAFNSFELGTNNEGSVDCIAGFPALLKVSREGDFLSLSCSEGDCIKIWAGEPSYNKEPLILNPGDHEIRIHEHFGRYEGKLVVQAFEEDILLDERIQTLPTAEARLISEKVQTSPARRCPKGMVRIPEGNFTFHQTHGDDFIPYPEYQEGKTYKMGPYYMDIHPVTNAEFLEFIRDSGYQPSDSSRFLEHWVQGAIPDGLEDYPVVYVSLEDARAYAKWAGKRLPTELEWQYAAQTGELNPWPWKQKEPVTRKNTPVTATLTVMEIEGIDSCRCNLGTGVPDPVGKYPEGRNPFGLEDLVGSVWQLTNDVYHNGSYRYILMKGGSYYKPTSSWWYVQGGPRELTYRQYLLRVSQGFERNATVGFRCVKDAR